MHTEPTLSPTGLNFHNVFQLFPVGWARWCTKANRHKYEITVWFEWMKEQCLAWSTSTSQQFLSIKWQFYRVRREFYYLLLLCTHKCNKNAEIQYLIRARFNCLNNLSIIVCLICQIMTIKVFTALMSVLLSFIDQLAPVPACLPFLTEDILAKMLLKCHKSWKGNL